MDGLGPLLRSSFDQSELVSSICLRPLESGDDFVIGYERVNLPTADWIGIFRAGTTPEKGKPVWVRPETEAAIRAFMDQHRAPKAERVA